MVAGFRCFPKVGPHGRTRWGAFEFLESVTLAGLAGKASVLKFEQICGGTLPGVRHALRAVFWPRTSRFPTCNR